MLNSQQSSINFNKCVVKNISGVLEESGIKFSGQVVATNDSLECTMDIKPKTKQWWLDMGKQVGGAFEESIVQQFNGPQQHT